MKFIFSFLFICFSFVLSAQIDSTDIKLQHYKDLFIKGLITAPEYEQLKQQELGLKPVQQQPKTIIIQQPKPKPEIDSIQAQKMRNHYTGNIIVGVAASGLGIGLISGGVVYHNRIQTEISNSVDGIHQNQLIKQDRIVTISMCLFGSISTALGITAIVVGANQRHKVKQYDRSLTVNISPASLGLTYNF